MKPLSSFIWKKLRAHPFPFITAHTSAMPRLQLEGCTMFNWLLSRSIVSQASSGKRNFTFSGTESKPLLKSDLELWTKKVFVKRTLPELLLAWLVYRISSINSLVKVTPTLLRWAERYHVSSPIYFFIRKTLFKHFCGGESAKELVSSMQQLAASKVCCILDLAIESDLGGDQIACKYDRTRDSLLECIQTAGMVQNSFAALKITSLCPPRYLDLISKGINRISHAFMASSTTGDRFGSVDEGSFQKMICQVFHNTITPNLIQELFKRADSNLDGKLTYLDCILTFYPKSLSQNSPALFPSLYSGVTLDVLQQVLNRIDQIGQAAAEHKVRIMVDAEQSYFQPAIDYFVHEMQLKFNQPEFLLDGAPLIMNTHQMYLKSAIETLRSDVQRARLSGYFFATKLVRGAYMHGEREYARINGLVDPIHESKDQTDNTYRQAIDFLLDLIMEERGKASPPGDNRIGGNTSFVVASHNHSTVFYCLNSMYSKGLDPESPLIGFAQLQGMSDHLTFMLAENNLRVFKYLPYGPLREVIPYLLRRALENGDVLSSTYYDRIYVQNALLDRLVCSKFATISRPKSTISSINNYQNQ